MTVRSIAAALLALRGRRREASTALLLVMVLLAGAAREPGRSAAHPEPHDSIEALEQVNETPVELSTGYPVPYVSDCDPGESPPRCGAPPAQWSVSKRPVRFCTFASVRPPWLTAELFRDYVQQAANVWNRVEAAIGVDYTGDCTGARWERRDGVNQISFDDERNLLNGATLGLTESSIAWAPPTNPTIRRIDEADIILAENFANVPACLLSTITHEMGHALGFGHSTNPDDLMYASVDLSRPDTCHLDPSASEQSRLQDLYGVDQLPEVTVAPDLATPITLPFTVHSSASDPDGQGLTFSWEQLAGQPVEMFTVGPSMSFTAPNSAGILQFRVTAYDPYLHFDSAVVSITAYISQGQLTYGEIPAEGGFELVIFGGGGNGDLLFASGCPPATASFWTTDDVGRFVVYLPGSLVQIVNQAWDAKFADGIPAGTPLLGKCR